MSIETEEVGNVLVVNLKGRLDSNNAAEAENQVLGFIASGKKALVFDFSGLDYISSAGLRVMLMAAKRLKQGGGAMVLCSLKDHITEVFQISGFLSILTVCANRGEAMAKVAG